MKSIKKIVVALFFVVTAMMLCAPAFAAAKKIDITKKPYTVSVGTLYHVVNNQKGGASWNGYLSFKPKADGIYKIMVSDYGPDFGITYFEVFKSKTLLSYTLGHAIAKNASSAKKAKGYSLAQIKKDFSGDIRSYKAAYGKTEDHWAKFIHDFLKKYTLNLKGKNVVYTIRLKKGEMFYFYISPNSSSGNQHSYMFKLYK